MPIVVVTALAAEQAVVDRLLSRVVTAVAEGAGCAPEDVWASFVPAAAQHVGPRVAGPADQCPVVVIRGRVRGGDQVNGGLSAAARAVAAELGVPVEDVWLHWVDVTAGRVFAGGDMI